MIPLHPCLNNLAEQGGKVMKLIRHIFDTTAALPADSPVVGTSVTVHCDKELIVRPINSFAQTNELIEACEICLQKSHQFMISHSNRLITTVFVLEEVETAKKKGKR